jgi:hypothetical protein
MKRKLFFGLIGGILALFTILSANTSLNNSSDISLKNIKVMAQANAEDGPMCPHPCVENGNGCYCWVFYPFYYEKF